MALYADQLPHDTLILTAFSGQLDLLDEEPDESDGGYDSLTQTWLLKASDAAEARALLPEKQALVTAECGGLWRCTRVAVRPTARHLWLGTLSAVGWLTGSGPTHPYRIRLGAGSQVNSSAVSETETFEGRTALPTLSISYFYTGSLPSQTQVGNNYNFPSGINPNTPANPWNLSDPEAQRTLHQPYGWILEARDGDQIVSAGESSLWIVTDHVYYQHQYTPR